MSVNAARPDLTAPAEAAGIETQTTSCSILTALATAPRGDCARRGFIRISNAAGKVVDHANRSETVHCAVVYRVLVADSVLHRSLCGQNREDGTVFPSTNVTDEQRCAPPHAVGHYASLCNMPPNCCTAGRDLITMLLVARGRDSIAHVDRAVSVDMVDICLARDYARNPVALERLTYDHTAETVTDRCGKSEGPTAGPRPPTRSRSWTGSSCAFPTTAASPRGTTAGMPIGHAGDGVRWSPARPIRRSVRAVPADHRSAIAPHTTATQTESPIQIPDQEIPGCAPPAMTDNLVVHIGLHKTATTWLQRQAFIPAFGVQLLADARNPWDDAVLRALVTGQDFEPAAVRQELHG